MVNKNPFSDLARVPEVDEVWLFGSRAIGNNSPDSDYDVAIQTGFDYETEDKLYKHLVNCKLANPKLDMSIFTPKESYAIISSLQDTYFREHLIKSAKVVIDNHKLMSRRHKFLQENSNYQMQKVLKENADKWTNSYKRLSIPAELLADLSFALNRSRRYSYQIPYYLETDGLTESVKHQAQSMRSSLKAIVGIGLRIADPEDEFLEKNAKMFSEVYSWNSEKYASSLEDFLKRRMNTSSIRETISDVNLTRRLTELCCNSINQDLEYKFEHYELWKIP